MIARDALLVDFDHEMAVTRQLLERVPEAALAWKPHEKSFSLGGLAMHLARIPHWGARILEQTSYDVSGDRPAPPEASSLAEVLEVFDRNVAEVRRALLLGSDGEIMASWRLVRGTQTVMTLPRVSAFRRFVVHHVIHHRGQLSVYLRLQEVALPPIYGSTADERL